MERDLAVDGKRSTIILRYTGRASMVAEPEAWRRLFGSCWSPLILHVADASLPEDRLREQIAAVNAVLTEIGGEDLPIVLVFNKVDRLDPLGRRRLANRFPEAQQVSAATGAGLDGLREQIATLFADRFEDVRLLVPYDEGHALSALYALGAPIDERHDTDAGVMIRAKLSHRDTRRFARYLVAGDDLESAATT